MKKTGRVLVILNVAGGCQRLFARTRYSSLIAGRADRRGVVRNPDGTCRAYLR